MNSNFAVVVTWNGEHCVAGCLKSLQESEAPVRVIVVDNASTDYTLDVVRQVCPEATCFCLSRNLGFGRANNIGMKYAYDQGAEHVLLINQDAFVGPDVVGDLVDLQRSNPRFGVLSPLHLNGPGTELDRGFCEHISEASSLRQILGDALLDRQSPSVYEVEFINAAVWLLSRECVERVGLFNPAFEHYGEDKEYADRVRFRGLHLGLALDLRAFHARSQHKRNGEISLERYLTQEKAIIRYRISRGMRSTVFNVLSALKRVLLSKYPGNGRFFRCLEAKLLLIVSLLPSTVEVLRKRRIAYRGDRCFFPEAETDKKRWLVRVD
jgi:GT2 family glycosyltransferase